MMCFAYQYEIIYSKMLKGVDRNIFRSADCWGR